MPTATAEVVAALTGYRYTFADEDQLQQALFEALTRAGHGVEREVRLDKRNRIDLLTATGVGIEVKVAGRWTSTVAQLERYAAHDRVKEILLVTNRRWMMHIPDEWDGKPIAVFNVASGVPA